MCYNKHSLFVILFVLLVFDVYCEGQVTCVIEHRTQSAKLCKFPFVYKGYAFQNCTDYNDKEGRFWCSTNTTISDAKHVTNQGYWGICFPKNATKEVKENLEECEQIGLHGQNNGITDRRIKEFMKNVLNVTGNISNAICK